MNLKELSLEELLKLKKEIEDEIKKRDTSNGVTVELQTDGWFDRRKHGNAYVAIIKENKSGKIERKFIDMTQKVWDTKHKYYMAKWLFKANFGDKIEARLTDGSWKNDYRQYFIVTEDGLKSVERKDVLGM